MTPTSAGTAQAPAARSRPRPGAGARLWQWVTGGPGIERSLRRRAALVRLGVLAVFVVVWQVAATLGLIDPLFVATPVRVAAAWVDLATSAQAWGAFEQTVQELLTAFVLGTAAGLGFGVLVSLSRPLRDAYLGPVVFMLSVPKSVFVPFFVLLFGLGRVSASIFGAFSAFFYVAVNFVGGIDLVEDRHRQVARAFGANRRFMFTDVTLPGSLPGLFAALWQGVKHGFGGVLIAELWASHGGIGQLIETYTSLFRAGHVLAITLTVALLAILMGSLWTRLEQRVDWRKSETSATGAGATNG